VGGRRVSRYARTPEDAWKFYAELKVKRSRGRIRRSEYTVAAWLEHREAEARFPGRQAEGWLIPASTGRMLLHTNIHRDFLKGVNAAGMPAIRLHDLCHTAANLMRQIGIPRKLRMQILGHQVRDVHNLYAHHVEPSLFGHLRPSRASSLTRLGSLWSRRKTDGAETPS